MTVWPMETVSARRLDMSRTTLRRIRCRKATWSSYCGVHLVDSWPCSKALALAALIEARDREVRADECDDIAEEFSGAPSRCDLEDRAEAWRLAPRPRGMDR